MVAQERAGFFSHLEGWLRALNAYARYINIAVSGLVLALLIIHRYLPNVLSHYGKNFYLEFCIILLAFLIDRILRLEERVESDKLKVFESREVAYDELRSILKRSRRKRIELLQFSGVVAVPLLKEIAQSSPEAEVRLFVCHPDVAANFEKGGDHDHCKRIEMTLGELKVIREQFPHFRVRAYFYRTPPSIAGVVIDDRIVSVGWYHCFPDEKNTGIVKIRGGTSAAIIAMDEPAAVLVGLVQKQISKLEKCLEDAPA